MESNNNLERKVEELTEKFNQLVERLNNAKIRTVLSFEDLEIEEDYETLDDLDDEEEDIKLL